MDNEDATPGGPGADSAGIAWQGREEHPLDRDLAELNLDVYAETGSVLNGWFPLVPSQLERVGIAPERLVDPQSGFYARVYAHNEHGYALVLRGTDEGQDWHSNLRQGVGLKDAQYDRAVEVSTAARNAFGDNLVLTGHSLGGGLAALGALRTGVPAVTFNAAGIHNRTLHTFGIDEDVRQFAANSGHIRRYTVENDVLTVLQEHALQTRLLLPSAIGYRIRLQDPDPLSLFERIVPGRGLLHGVEAHSMETVLRALDLPERVQHPSHPVTLLQQSLRGLRSLQEAPTYPNLSLESLANTATFLAARAKECGLSRIDHLAASDDGSRLFAIQGSRADPAQRRVTVDAASAACTPAAQSATALREMPTELQQAHLVPRIDWQQAHHVLGH